MQNMHSINTVITFLLSFMQIIAYLRVSSSTQELQNQKLAVMEYAHHEGLQIDRFIEVELSTRKASQKKQLDTAIDKLKSGDLLLISELSRIGRNISSIITTIDKLIQQNVKLISIKENIRIDGEHNIQSKMLVTMFGLLAELERDLISQRTKEGLKNARAKGKKIGRPKGTKGKSKLDGKEQEIITYLDKKISKANIAKLLNVSRTTLNYFIESRNLEASSLLKTIQKDSKIAR